LNRQTTYRKAREEKTTFLFEVFLFRLIVFDEITNDEREHFSSTMTD